MAVGATANILGWEISTELAVNFFGIASGTFGALAGLVAARRLAKAPDRIPIRNLVIPVTVAGVSTVLGALLVPTDG